MTDSQDPDVGTGSGDGKDDPVRPVLSRREFIDRVADRLGVDQRAEVRATVDAVLEVLRETLSSGHDLNCPPLGRLSLRREKENERKRILVLRLALATTQESADPEEGPDPAEG